MSETLTVSTPFADVSELAQGFVERVDEAQLLIPAAVEVPEGEWAAFTVLLADGTPAFAGLGRCLQVSDRGEDTPPDQARYEVLLDSLQFEQASQAVFDHMVAVRAALLGEDEAADVEEDLVESLPPESLPPEAMEVEGAEPGFPRETGTEEIAGPELEEVPADASLPPASEAEVTLESLGPEADPGATQTLAAWPSCPPEPGEVAAADAELAEAPQAEAYGGAIEGEVSEAAELAPTSSPFAQEPTADAYPSRPVLPNSWRPQAPSRPQPRQPSELFVYGRGQLPRPERPPRPELDPALRVSPAPRPNGHGGPSRNAAQAASEALNAAAMVDEEPREAAAMQQRVASHAHRYGEGLAETEELLSIPPDAELS